MKNQIKRFIRTECPLCGDFGHSIHQNLNDGLYSTSEGWGFKKCNNANCTLVWITPCPVEEDIPKLYLAYPTHKDAEISLKPKNSILGYARKISDSNRSRKIERLSFLSNAIAKTILWSHPGGMDEDNGRSIFLPTGATPGSVLEIGCGDGMALSHLRNVGWNTTGIEPDPVSRKIALARGLNVKESIADLDSQKFSAIVMHHVIEHLMDPQKTLMRLRENLITGGRLILVTPNIDSYLHKQFGKAWYPLDPPRHIHLFNKRSIMALLAQSGYREIQAFASVKGMRPYFARSVELKRFGKTDPNGPISLISKLKSASIQYWLRISKNDRDLGDELIAMATNR